VVIIGGGVGGSIVSKSLEKIFQVTLIDRKDYFEYTPGRITSLLKPLYLDNVKKEYSKFLFSGFVKGEVTGINLQSVTVENDSKKMEIEYDYLVIASGCEYNQKFKNFKGDRIIDIKTNFGTEKISDSKDIAVVGGGPCGVEIASILAEKYPNKTIHLISRDSLLKRFQNGNSLLFDFFSKNMKNLKIVNINVSKITQEDNTIFIEAENRKFCFKYDLVFLATGFSPSVNYLKPYLSDYMNKFDHFKVNRYFQLSNRINDQEIILKNIFAIGDVVALKEDLLASNTMNHAICTIQNIISLESDCNFKSYQSMEREIILHLGSEHSLVITNGLARISGKIELKKKQVLEVNMMNYLKSI
jgi:apoptosis-inducing factor 2